MINLYSLLPYITLAINSILLAVYYSSYLVPKSNRVSGKVMFASFGVAYFILQVLMDNFFTMSQWGPGVISLRAIVLIVLVFALSVLFFKSNLRLGVFLLLSFFAAQEICAYIQMGVGQLLGYGHTYFLDYLMAVDYFTSSEQFVAVSNGYVVFQFFIELAAYTAIVALTLRSIARRFAYKDYPLSPQELSYLLLPCFPGLVITHFIRALLVRQNDFGIYEVYNETPSVYVIVPITGVILLLSMVAAVRFLHRLSELHNEKTERIVLQKQMSQLQLQVNDVDSIYAEMMGFKHDLKNHVSNILILSNAVIEGSEDVKDELEKYIAKISETLDKFEFTCKTGNSISDIIIHQKQIESSKHGIDFTADFLCPPYLNIDAYDMAIILNNALENAIEACSAMQKGFIRLSAYTKMHMFFIDVENSFNNTVVFDDNTGLPISSKPDNTAHGIGLSNIRRCARKYYGDIDIHVSDEDDMSVFCLTVMLQGSD